MMNSDWAVVKIIEAKGGQEESFFAAFLWTKQKASLADFCAVLRSLCLC